MASMILFTELTFAGLSELLVREGFKAGHARTIWQEVYRSATLPLSDIRVKSRQLAGWLNERIDFSSPLVIDQIRNSQDGSQKVLFRTRDGLIIETVFIPQGKRKTLCLSSQAGCPWNCRFCATGAMGFKRDLSVAEMISQVLDMQNLLGQKMSNLVFMGMGEPLSNFTHLNDSLDILSHPLGISLPPRRITISTIGLLDQIRQIIEKKWTFPLAISLHHHNRQLREELMPGTRANPLDELMVLLERYTRELNRPVFFEYLLLSDVNDSSADAEALFKLLSRLPCRINLIHFHPFGTSKFTPSSPEREEVFYRFMQKTGIPTIFRKSRGEDIQAACGQLAGNLFTQQKR